MCSECGEPQCNFCGAFCRGLCDDPDSCPSCWLDHEPDHDMETDSELEVSECMDECCECSCHSVVEDRLRKKWDYDIQTWGERDLPPFNRKGVFPFLRLPGEVRSKIEYYALRQVGTYRLSPHFRGKIDTALLFTCRKINEEARHLPLTINSLCFGSPTCALKFLFQLQPNQRHLVTKLHLEIQGPGAIHDPTLLLLVQQLAKMEIIGLGVTIMGACPAEYFQGHSCFVGLFRELKHLKTFDLVIGSYMLTSKAKANIIKDVRRQILKDPKKRARSNDASSDGLGAANSATRPFKLLKLSAPSYTLSTGQCHRSPESAREKVKKSLINVHEMLQEYAYSHGNDASLVAIRMKRAWEAAQRVKEDEFNELVSSILQTLDGRFFEISASRKQLPMSLRKS